MGKRKSNQSKTVVAIARSLEPVRPDMNWKFEVPDFTPEQWAWLKDQSRQFEKDYVPTRSLIAGL
jgi:hypothetical protein